MERMFSFVRQKPTNCIVKTEHIDTMGFCERVLNKAGAKFVFVWHLFTTFKHRITKATTHRWCVEVMFLSPGGPLLSSGTRLPPPPLPALQAHLVAKGQ